MSETKGEGISGNAGENRVTLAEMRAGESGRIVEISSEHGLDRRLDALGIRVGKKITKVSEQLMRGPVLLRQGHTQIALGRGMASKVVVELDGRG